MSDDRTPSGQFAEPAFGREGLEREAGFTPMADPNKKDDGDQLTLNDAAQIRATEAPAPVLREYRDNGQPVDSNETLTLDRAAGDLSAIRNAEHEEAENDAAKALRKHIDGLRGKDGADAAGDAGQPEANAEGAAEPASEGDIKPDLERALNHPRVREAIRAQVAETETARQQYQAGIDAALSISQQTFMGQFPEFASVTSPEQAAQVGQAIAQSNPGRWAHIQSAFANSSRLFEAQRIEHQRATERHAAEFADYTKEQDRLVDEAMKGVPVALQHQIQGEIFAMAKEYGIEPAEFVRMGNQDRTMRHHAFQRMMIDAARYRIVQQASKQAVTKPVPSVARPGVRPSSGSSGAEKIRALSATFQNDPSLKNAVAMLGARRTSRS